jgi:hypothetical protein
MATSGIRRRATPRLRALRRVGAVGVIGLAGLTAGCGSEAPPVSYDIVPVSGMLGPGAEEQFAATTDAPVLWGLAETDPLSESRPAYPLKVAPGGRYLVDQDDHPWRVQADAAWLMSSEATPAEVDHYLATRRAQGFNSFYLMAMVHPGGYDAAHHAPNNRNGDPPFATPGDFSTAGATPQSERYWEWIDTIIDKAADHGLVVMLAYDYLGFGGGDQGWYQEVSALPSVQAAYDWGQWLGSRYKSKPNIIWFGLGDFGPPPGSPQSKRIVATAKGIKAAGATQLFMAEPSPPNHIPGEHPDFGQIVDQNSFYGYGPNGVGTVYDTADQAWRDSPTKPAWMQEGTYEYEDNTGHFSGEPWETRRGRFWSVLAGGTAGDGFGSKQVWQWTDLPRSLATPGAAYSTYAFSLFETLPWWELRPSGTDPGFAGADLVPSGQGTWGKKDYITSAITTDRSWLLAYVPVTGHGPRTFSVDMAALNGPTRARWFDPATGTYLSISDGHDEDNVGRRDFTTPGKRSDGTDDWLLVLDTDGADACGTITSSGLYTGPTSVAPGVTCEVTATLQSEPGTVVRRAVSVNP